MVLEPMVNAIFILHVLLILNSYVHWLCVVQALITQLRNNHAQLLQSIVLDIIKWVK